MPLTANDIVNRLKQTQPAPPPPKPSPYATFVEVSDLLTVFDFDRVMDQRHTEIVEGLKPDVSLWLQTNVGPPKGAWDVEGPPERPTYGIGFQNHSDAIAFKLRFADYFEEKPRPEY